MTRYPLSLLLTLLSLSCFCQQTYTPRPQVSATPSYGDTVGPRGFSNYQKEKRVVIFENGITYSTSNMLVTQTEKDIIELEGRECKALKERDTAALLQLWARDFTRDKDPNTLVEGASPIPQYMSLNRSVDNLTIMAPNIISTSGKEGFQEIRLGKVVSGTRPYFHTWTKQNQLWKLTTKGE